jgi:hypothetical protein
MARMDGQDVGPDLVVVGAARSGTSYLASVLAEHSRIDAGAVKEPNYFSRELHRGTKWYDGLYESRRPGLLRMDASMSYTFPQFPEALQHLAEAAPSAQLVYVVREPISRALSHYQLNKDYFHNDDSVDFGTALRTNPVYAGTGDYERWLSVLMEHFSPRQVIIAPFSLVTSEAAHVATMICRALGIEPSPTDLARDDSHRNDVVTMRNPAIRSARRLVKQSGAYPMVRRTVGVDRLRRARALLTRPVTREPLEQALMTCSTEQLHDLDSLYARSRAAVARALSEQDAALGLTWSQSWTNDTPIDSSPAAAALKRAGDGES